MNHPATGPGFFSDCNNPKLCSKTSDFSDGISCVKPVKNDIFEQPMQNQVMFFLQYTTYLIIRVPFYNHDKWTYLIMLCQLLYILMSLLK